MRAGSPIAACRHARRVGPGFHPATHVPPGWQMTVRARSIPADLLAFAEAAAEHWTGAPIHAHAIAAGFSARAGDLPAARRHTAIVADLGSWRADRSYLWSVGMRELAVAAIALDDRSVCEELLADLTPIAATCGVRRRRRRVRRPQASPTARSHGAGRRGARPHRQRSFEQEIVAELVVSPATVRNPSPASSRSCTYATEPKISSSPATPDSPDGGCSSHRTPNARPITPRDCVVCGPRTALLDQSVGPAPRARGALASSVLSVGTHPQCRM
jgi:hypothetical protein